MADNRFARLKTDPRFRRPKKHKAKIVIDERFHSVLAQEKKARTKTRVDKYGRSLTQNQEGHNLDRFYREEHVALPDYARGAVLLESSDEEKEPENDDSDDGKYVAIGNYPDQNVEINLDEDSFAELDAQAAAFQETIAEQADTVVDRTRRLAFVNLDWDHVKAVHILKICSSIVSSATKGVTGRVQNVRIYPSQFGKERLAREEKEGPPEEIFQRRGDDNDVKEHNIFEVGGEDNYDIEALRHYQLQRMRYYYAIVECDTVEVASVIYDELEGTELERSANVFDLSFVPDDMSFVGELRDEATENDVASSFKAVDFVTEALQHSKVKLKWDEDDPERHQITRRTLTKKEIDSGDFHNFLASASSDSESEHEKQTNKKSTSRDALRALLLGKSADEMPEGWGDENKDDVDMQVTFSAGLSESKTDETTLDTYQRKMREKRKKRRMDQNHKVSDNDGFFESDSEREDRRPVAGSEELALLASGEKEPKHFDMKAILKSEKKTRRKGKHKETNDMEETETQDDFSVDVLDERFKAVHEDHNFAIDPSNPHFKRTKAMSKLLEERRRRQIKRKAMSSGESQNLATLVDNIKKRRRLD